MERERKVWWHWSNERPAKWFFKFPIEGRFWLYVFAWTFRLEWNLWGKACRIGADVGDTSGDLDALQFSIAFPPVSFWFTICAPYKAWVWKFLPEPGREIELTVHNWAVWLKLWGRWGEWNSRDPWWVRGITFHIDDFILGDRKCVTEETRQPKRIAVEFDGYLYLGTAKFQRRTWKRPRWFAFVRESVTIDMDPGHGLPRAGKGENSWDCGDDAVCGWGVDGPPTDETVERAIDRGREICLEARKRYGQPSKYGPQPVPERGPDEYAAQNAIGPG